MIVTLILACTVMLLVLHTIIVGSTFHQSLIKIFQIVQDSWKGQGRGMNRWVDELIDRWAHDVHFHDPLSKLWLRLGRHSEAVQTVFNILYQQTISSYNCSFFS